MNIRDRYVPRDIAEIWDPDHRYVEWFKVGLELVESRERSGAIPLGTARELSKLQDRISPERCDDLGAEHGHEVVGYLCHIQELSNEHLANPSLARYLHLGLTSSDLVDTAIGIRVGASVYEMQTRLMQVESRLRHKMIEYASTVHLARTHGQPAHPVTFGFVLASHLAELDRAVYRLDELEIYGKLSGPVGNNLFIDSAAEQEALAKMDLAKTSVATQVVPRDNYTDTVYACVQVAAMVERFALNIRLLQSLGEVRESQAVANYSGSSAMPHKSNPISSERLCGLARVVRSMLPAFLENQAMWQSRDLAHSSAERLLLPDVFGLTISMLDTMDTLLERLYVNESAMKWGAGEATHSESLLYLLQKDHGMGYLEANGRVKGLVTEARGVGETLGKLILEHYGAAAYEWCMDQSRYVQASRDAIDEFLVGRGDPALQQ